MATNSAGIILYRKNDGVLEVFLVHPGGPFWKNKDAGVWSIPKGEPDNNDADLLVAAKREFREETGMEIDGDFIDIGSVKRKDGKIVYVWAIEGDIDTSAVRSNTILIDWPPKSGRKLEIPEVDRGEFFDLSTARTKLVLYQIPLIDALIKLIVN